MKFLLPVFGIVILFAAGCNKSYEPPIPLLPGLWQETEAPGQTSGFTYRIKFAEDSTFRLWRYIFNDTMGTADPCSNSHTQHIQGFYQLDADKLRLRGHFFDTAFSTQITDCSGTTSYVVQHSIGSSGTNLVLDDEAGKYGRIVLVPVKP